MHKPQPHNELKGKVICIIGASYGLGYALSMELSKYGSKIVAVARSQTKLEELDDKIKKLDYLRPCIVPLDITVNNATDHLAFGIYQKFQKCDILINCAAQLGTLSPLSHLDAKEWDSTFKINVTSNYLLIKSFEPLMKNNEKKLIMICHDSVSPRIKAYWSLYSATKSALESMVYCYSLEAKNSKVKTVLFNPGKMNTPFAQKISPGINTTLYPDPISVAKKIAFSLCNIKDIASGQLIDFST